MAVRATTPTSTADQPAQNCTSRRRLLRQAKTVLATEDALPQHHAAAVTEIFWTKPSTGTPKDVREQVDSADDDGEDSAEDNADHMTAGRTWEGLEEDIAYCEMEGLTQDVSLAVWWVRQWTTAIPSATNPTLEEWSEFSWNVCGFEVDLPTAASVLSPAFVAALAEEGVPFAMRRFELISKGALHPEDNLPDDPARGLEGADNEVNDLGPATA
ncbi:unnamed protein product [Polarella glacialis]|uniref:Uncharacterized protein n=1 Tax=Polarella glacialis TaxID=89957 RepID=A0A813L4W9_POLGL|nr:unnamed protein product [Polarella glacialis]CAE8599751.1 unnamed protein product [Polarella glacialis]CAE8719541.1 unnamed protein product [Polarella glacialis]